MSDLGFHNLPFIAHRKSVKKGFEFTVMVVGESGLGKSTLIQTLFQTDLYGQRVYPAAIDRVEKTVHIDTFTVDIEERGVKLKLTVVDTPGFGDAVDNSECWSPIIEYVNRQYDNYFKDESGLNRRNLEDHRIHCCLYFINPSAHGLRPIDVRFMKELHELVNIIPVIAKADTLTPKEVKELKQKVFREIQDHGIQIFVPDLFEDDEVSNTEVKEIRTGIPFAVVGSNTLLEVNGKKVRGRIYPWGVVEVENKKHSDFILLRDMMMRTHMQDLKDITQDIHYENFRKKKLTEGEGMSPYLGSRKTPEITTTDGNENPDLLKEQLRMMQAEMERLKAALGKDGEEAAV